MIDQAWVNAKRAELSTLRQRTQQEIDGLVARLNRLEGGEIALREVEKALQGEEDNSEVSYES